MTDYSNLTTSQIVDLLAEETQKFTHFLKEKEVTPESERCKQAIKTLLEIIEMRTGDS